MDCDEDEGERRRGGEEEEEEEEDDDDEGKRQRRRDHHVLFFGRYPTPGKCKTRLATDLMRENCGDETVAAKLYELCTERVLNGFLRDIDERSEEERCDATIRLVFYVAHSADVGRVRTWLRESLEVHAKDEREEEEEQQQQQQQFVEVRAQDQKTNDLGLRMIRAINEECDAIEKKGPMRESHVIHVVGTDYPNACWKRLEENTNVRATARDNPICFGKAEDGGFWHVSTVGRLSEDFFGKEDEKLVRWSTNNTLEDAKNAAKKVGMNPRVEDVGNPLHDIDTLEDVRKWMRATTTNKSHMEDDFTQLARQVANSQ